MLDRGHCDPHRDYQSSVKYSKAQFTRFIVYNLHNLHKRSFDLRILAVDLAVGRCEMDFTAGEVNKYEGFDYMH